MDFKEYDDSYESSMRTIENDRNKKMYYWVKNIYLRFNKMYDNSKNISILNIGSGPCESAERFVNNLLPHCNTIYLCEINPLFCQKYEESEWYKTVNINNKRIIVLNADIQDSQSIKYFESRKVKFNVIWCNHMLYNIKLNSIPNFLLSLNSLLKNRFSVMIIGIIDDDTIEAKSLQQAIKPQYHLSEHLINCIKKLDWYNEKHLTLLYEKVPIKMTKNEAKSLFELFVKQDLFYNTDYHPSKIITNKDLNDISKVVDNACDKLLVPITNNQNKMQYIWYEETTYYVINKVEKKMSISKAKL